MIKFYFLFIEIKKDFWIFDSIMEKNQFSLTVI